MSAVAVWDVLMLAGELEACVVVVQVGLCTNVPLIASSLHRLKNIVNY